jgi:hypothetical protein
VSINDDTAEHSRIRLLARQTGLARFGELALRSDDLAQILHDACRMAAAGLGTDLAEILELRPDGSTMLVRAGVGWQDGVVGKVTPEADKGSSEGYAPAPAPRWSTPMSSTRIGFHHRVRLMPEVTVSPEPTAPLGLMVNEFITNSLKYACGWSPAGPGWCA